MKTKRQLTLEFEHRPSLSGDDFLVAPANTEAIDWIDRWPDWPAQALAISGPAGCGKSHLAHVFMARSGARSVAIHDLDVARARTLVMEHPALVVEDAEAIAGSEHEESLFHILNVLRETGRHALITSRQPPARWSVKLADLRSRLNALPHVAISDPSDGLIAAVLVKQFADRQLRIDAAIIDYILPRLERSFRAVECVVDAIDKAALSEQRKITVPLVRHVLDAMDDQSTDEQEN